MKIILISLTLTAVASLLWFCKHQPRFSAENLPSQQLRWGSGGGFVGKETTNTLLQNGQVFKREMAGPLAESNKIKSKKAAAVFKTAAALGFSKLEFDHPGNVYSFLEWQEGDAVSRITWGDPNYTVNTEVQVLFDQLNGLLKK